MFHDWDSFYLLIGGAAGAMISLLFVVATLTSGVEQEGAARGVDIYTTPTVFHFGVVMVLSAVASVPALHERAVGAVAALCGLAGLAYAVVSTWRIRTGEAPHWSDIHFYGCLPAALYALMLAAAAAVWLGDPLAAYLYGFGLLALILLSIRNAWDLVTWLAPRKAAADAGKVSG